MATVTKRRKAIDAKVDRTKVYAIDEAITVIKEVSTTKFNETVEVSINLGVDPRKSDQIVRGSVILPKGTGQDVRVAVFAQGENAKAAQDAGADIVGYEDLLADIKKGEMNFDVVIATPDAMRVVGQLGQILGPRGLMPNPKDGTVTPDVAKAVKNAKAGQVKYRTDKAGIIHCGVGKVKFEVADLKENIEALIAALKKAKPTSAKGVYFRKITLSSTMGPGLLTDVSSISTS